jgi:hypothetical protein
MGDGGGLEALRFFQLLKFVREQLSEEYIFAVLCLGVQQVLKASNILGRYPFGVYFGCCLIHHGRRVIPLAGQS